MKPEIEAAEPAVERLLRPLPKEGDHGLYTQSWYPICLSSEVETGQVISREFLGGRVIVFRGENGVVAVLSPYCTHMGMDLSFGKVVGNNIRCRYHHYEFGADGQCTKTGWDQPVPKGACQFSFPTSDRYGIVWAFNGTTPLFELPDMAVADEELTFDAWAIEQTVPCSTTEVFVQVADWGHLRFMHEGTVQTNESQQNRVPDFKFSPYNFGYEVASMTFAGEERGEGGQEFPQVKIYVHGTTIIHIETYVQGNWAGVIGATALRGPGKTQIFGAVAVRKGDGSAEANEAVQKQLAFHKKQVQVTGAEDFVIYENIRFAPGAFTEIDDMVVKYLDYVAAFPRANPAVNFIYG